MDRVNTDNATATTAYTSGYNCPNCSQWVNGYSTVPHICTNYQPAWPTATVDPRLLAVLERIAVALEAAAPPYPDSLAPKRTSGAKVEALKAG